MRKPNAARVSLCLIVRNEAHQLADCLAPVAHLCDETVIVDTGSRDATLKIAKRYASRIISFPWCDDFSAARNEALRHAQGDWILWLDADDRLSPAHAEKLRVLIAGLSDKPQAFLMQCVLHLNRESRDPKRVVSHLRLFRRHPSLKWHRRVHENLDPWPASLGHEVVFTDIQIDHLGYQDRTLLQRKMWRNLRLLRMEYAVAPDDPLVLADLGYAYAQLGKPAETRHFLSAVLAHPACSPYLRRRAFTTLGELENAEGNFAEAKAILSQAVRDFPDDEYLLYMKSEALYNFGLHAESKAALLQILRQPPVQDRLLSGGPADVRERLARLALGEVLRVEPNLAEAEQILLEVAADFPRDPAPWYFLGRVYIDWRNWNRLDDVLARLAACESGSIYAAILLASSQFCRKEWLATEKTLDALIAQVPYMILPRVMRLECLVNRWAPQHAQLQACRDVLRLQPSHARALRLAAQLEAANPKASSSAAPEFCTSVIFGAGDSPVIRESSSTSL